MATGWLKGTVKAVPSGDSLLIMGSVKGGPPPEKTITLAGLIAPKLVHYRPMVDFPLRLLRLFRFVPPIRVWGFGDWWAG